MEFRLSAKEAEIVELLLSRGEATGAELVDLAPRRFKPSAIYVQLKRLVDKGMLSARPMVNDPTAGPPRKLYRVTGHGATAVRARQAAEVAFRVALEIA